MSFTDTYSYQEALRALRGLAEARAALETAQSSFEEAARYDEAQRAAEAAMSALEDVLADLETGMQDLKERVEGFDEFDRATWAAGCRMSDARIRTYKRARQR